MDFDSTLFIDFQRGDSVQPNWVGPIGEACRKLTGPFKVLPRWVLPTMEI